MSIKSRTPWWAKIAAKMVFSRLGIPYSAFQRLGLFRLGSMDTADYLEGVFSKHVRAGGGVGQLDGKTVLEIGPGDGVGTALLAYAHGARAILLDTGRYAREDMDAYRKLAAVLAARGLPVPRLDDVRHVDDVVAACKASYLTEGLHSWEKVADASVDLVFSQAVLEHIRRHEFADTLSHCRRVMKSGAIGSHRIDLKDHLGGGLNNLRFSSRVWESDLFATSGFYTNRIQYHRMLQLFSEAGFSVSVTDVRRWGTLPIGRTHLAAEFRDVPDDELRVSGFDVLLRPITQ